jgi:membrane protein
VELGSALDRVDRYQESHPVLGFPLAVRRKYSEDQGGYLAATIAYYGFFSFFPLLLVLVTVLGYVLRGHPHLEDRILGSALGQLPVIGPELHQHALRGNLLALVIGIVAALWTGTSVLLAAESALYRIWGEPVGRDPGFVSGRLQALGLLGVLGGSLIVTTILSGIGTAGGRLGLALQVVAVVLALAANFGLFWLAFRLLTPASIPWSSLRGGAAAAAIGYEILQLLGSYYVTHTLKSATNVYGTFALVIGLLSWIYLTATIVLMAAEGNVVATRGLWPRPLSGPAPVPVREPAVLGTEEDMTTNIERFQKLQVELVRAGFETMLHAEPNGDKAILSLQVDLARHKGGGAENGSIEQFDALTSGHGFAYTIGKDSRAAITLAD